MSDAVNNGFVKFTKTKAKQPFKVQTFGVNGEKLGQAETFYNHADLLTNTLAYMRAFNGTSIEVRDECDREKKVRYTLYPDGTKVPISQ